LLWECVEAYTELDDEKQRVYEEMLKMERYKEIPPMQMTTYEKGQAEGFAMGEEQTRRRTARLLLERKFGPLSESVVLRLEAWPADRLEDLLLAVVDAKSLRDMGLAD
jgi:hypothetical protein